MQVFPADRPLAVVRKAGAFFWGAVPAGCHHGCGVEEAAVCGGRSSAPALIDAAVQPVFVLFSVEQERGDGAFRVAEAGGGHGQHEG